MGSDEIARNVVAVGTDADRVADELCHKLASPELRLAIVFADWRIDPARLANAVQRRLGPAPTVGCTALGVVPAASDQPCVAAVGFYGDWLRVGVGLAAELPKSPLARSRDAVVNAAAALGLAPEQLDPQRHVAITLSESTCGHEDAFCIGSAAAAPQIRFVGGSASTQFGRGRRSFVWARGEALADAAVVVVLESELPFEAVTSSHLVATDLKTVVTAAQGRLIDELDGRPAAARLQELVSKLGGKLDPNSPVEFSFARFVEGQPYTRTVTRIDGDQIRVASAVEAGHVLRIMRTGDLIGVTRRDLAAAAKRVGGEVAVLLAFSCIVRHWEAAARGLDRELAATYEAYPVTGFQSAGEQTGILLVNHTLTALAIGRQPLEPSSSYEPGAPW